MELTKSITSKQLLQIDLPKGKKIIVSGSVGQCGAKESRGIDIRQYYLDTDGEYKPTKKGIWLGVKELDLLLESFGFCPKDLSPIISNFLSPKTEKIPILSLKK